MYLFNNKRAVKFKNYYCIVLIITKKKTKMFVGSICVSFIVNGCWTEINKYSALSSQNNSGPLI